MVDTRDCRLQATKVEHRFEKNAIKLDKYFIPTYSFKFVENVDCEVAQELWQPLCQNLQVDKKELDWTMQTEQHRNTKHRYEKNCTHTNSKKSGKWGLEFLAPEELIKFRDFILFIDALPHGLRI